MTPAVAKLRKTFLLMLRSSVSGEAIAARDALLRIAEAEGYGPHELADALVAGTNGAPKRAQQNGEELDHREMAERCWDWFEAGVRLSEKEQKFIEDMMGWRKPSEKQLKWLKDIYARTIRRGA
jgi:hypothetical protein